MLGSGGLAFVSSAGTLNGGNLVSGATLTVSSGGSLLGMLTLSGGLAVISAAVGASTGVTYVGPGGKVALAAPTNFQATISGFGTADTIDLTAMAYSPAMTLTYAAGMLTVISGAQVVNLKMAGSYVTSNFSLATDGAAGTLIKFN